MRIRHARPSDFDRVMDVYAAARRYMARTGNPTQWGATKPTRDEIAGDIGRGVLLVGVDEADAPRFAFALLEGADPTYARIYDGTWANDEPYLTLHRVASDGSAHGVVAACVAYASDRAAGLGVRNLRIDTHENNLTMQHAVARAGFAYRGIIHLADGDPRLAYQLVLGTDGA